MKKRWLRLIGSILTDIIVAAVLLGVFYGYFYYIPREGESEDIVINSKQNIASSDKDGKQASSGGVTVENKDDTAGEITYTDTSYSSDSVSVTVQKVSTGSGQDMVTYYVADIVLKDINCLQSCFAKDTYGTGYTEYVLDMAQENNAVLAINGDYYGSGKSGAVIRNGKVYRQNSGDADVCVLYYDGTMATYTSAQFDMDAVIERGAYQAWTFGPSLLDENGNAYTSFQSSKRLLSANPRSGIGYYEPGHYCFVLVDGRNSGYSKGVTMAEYAAIFEQLGCKAAYNLDGGQSSTMTLHDSIVNQPYKGGRAVSDCIIIKEAGG